MQVQHTKGRNDVPGVGTCQQISSSGTQSMISNLVHTQLGEQLDLEAATWNTMPAEAVQGGGISTTCATIALPPSNTGDEEVSES